MRFCDIDERDMRRSERIRLARERNDMRARAEARMGHRTTSGRPFEEHRCAEMPYGYRIRRYACANNPYDRDILPCFTWTIVRVEVPDYWIEGDECQAVQLNSPGAEPCFCPWCGVSLGRLPDLIRGWDGKAGILTKEDFE